MTGLVESVFTCYQLSGLGVFYTYFLVFTWTFPLSLNLYVYTAFLGAVIVLFASENRLKNSSIEPKILLITGLFGMSICSAILATAIFADNDESTDTDSKRLQALPKCSICLFFIFLCITRASSVFYVTSINRYHTENWTASIISWVAVITLFGLSMAGYPDYLKNLASCLIAFGFLFLSLGLFLHDKLPRGRGLSEHELAQEMGFLQQKNVLKHEESRIFTTSEGLVTHCFRNLTTDKVAFKICFSNENDALENESDHQINYIRPRGHTRISIKLSQNRIQNDRFFILYAPIPRNSASNANLSSDSFSPSGFLTISLQR